MKYCPRCKKDKINNDFNKNRTKWDGLQSYCRSCKISTGWAQENRDRHNANNRKNRNSEYHRKWNQDHREQQKQSAIAATHKRRAKLKGCIEQSATATEMKTLKESARKCAMCQEILTDKTFEHIIPIHCGGSNALSNLAITCPSCNHGRPRNSLDWFALEQQVEALG